MPYRREKSYVVWWSEDSEFHNTYVHKGSAQTRPYVNIKNLYHSTKMELLINMKTRNKNKEFYIRKDDREAS